MIPRVLLATGHVTLAGALEQEMRDDEAIVRNIPDMQPIWEAIRFEPCDLLIVDRARIKPNPEQAIRDLLALPEPPEVIVLIDKDHTGARAGLLGAGALAVLSRESSPEELCIAARSLLDRVVHSVDRRSALNPDDRDPVLDDLHSQSPAMQEFLALVRRVAPSDSSLLMLGETGVGKEFLARAIHLQSPRAAGPFIPVHCAALSESLLESELFGHVAGAFTGAARSRRGYFELAHGGTVFLDEIGELSPRLQVMLLRVLQERQVQPVGAERTMSLDIRLMAATNRDLLEEMRADRFRSDLYYRLSVIQLTIPPLRDRKEDLPTLIDQQVRHFAALLRRPVRDVQSAARRVLLDYSWPGNVRELINVIERAVLLCRKDQIGLDDLPRELRDGERSTPQLGELDFERLLELPYEAARDQLLNRFERAYFQNLLKISAGRVGIAARRAGINTRTLYAKMRRVDLRKESFKLPPPEVPTRSGNPGSTPGP